MPSTMYTVTSAARISQGCDSREAWKALAVLWKPPRMVVGTPIRIMVSLMTTKALPSEMPGGRLNEMVVAANCPWWLTDSDVVVGS